MFTICLESMEKTVFFLLFVMFASSLGAVLEYSYTGVRGPLHWGEIKPEWRECREGKSQSPVAIRSKHAIENSTLGSLHAKYHQTVCSISSSRYIFKVFVSGAQCTLPVNHETYTLSDFHFHVPSEHTIDGVRFPLELHMVHRHSSHIAVVSKLFRLGKRDELLHRIIKSRGQNATLMLSDLISLRGGYYRYGGSLTTPPCTEGIIWTILKKAGTISPSQIKAVVAFLQGRNARPLQKINNRVIYKH